MAYYSVIRKDNNSLKHFGILGMHWGIRRFQPYSTVPRKSGKGGKEIGEAKKTSKESDKFEKEYERIKNTAKTDEDKDILLHELEVNRDLGSDLSKLSKTRKGNYGDLNIDYKDGDNEVHFFNFTEKYLNDKDAEVKLKQTILDYRNNREAINKVAFEAIKNDKYIKYWAPDEMTEKEFLSELSSKLSIRSIYDTGDGITEVSVYEKNDDDSLLGGHSLDMEIDLKNPKMPKYVSING